MNAASPTIAVVVLPVRGGARLAEAVAAAAWSDLRAVVALDGRRSPELLPRDVVTLDSPREIPRLAAQWVLLLTEIERVSADGVRAIRAAVGSAAPGDVFVLPPRTVLLDMEVGEAGGLARLAGHDVPLVLRDGLGLELSRAGGRVRPVDAALVRLRGTTLDEAVELAGAEGDLLAALAEQGGLRGAGILWHPLVAATRVLLGPERGARLGLGRWLVAVIEGYRVVVTYAKLWERRRDRGTPWVAERVG